MICIVEILIYICTHIQTHTWACVFMFILSESITMAYTVSTRLYYWLLKLLPDKKEALSKLRVSWSPFLSNPTSITMNKVCRLEMTFKATQVTCVTHICAELRGLALQSSHRVLWNENTSSCFLLQPWSWTIWLDTCSVLLMQLLPLSQRPLSCLQMVHFGRLLLPVWGPRLSFVFPGISCQMTSLSATHVRITITKVFTPIPAIFRIKCSSPNSRSVSATITYSTGLHQSLSFP